MRALCGSVVDADEPRFDKFLNAGAAELGHTSGDIAIETRAGVFRGDRKFLLHCV